MTELLKVDGLTVEFPASGGRNRPVQGTSFTLAPGEALGIVGESGSGKTMLALALMGLLPRGARASGEALLQPRTPKNGEARDGVVNLIAASPAQLRAIRGREIAMVFQEPLSALNPVMRIGAQIDEGIRAHEPRLSAKAVRERTLETMRRAAIPDPRRRARQYPHQLSGGLRQRAMMAMALAPGPRILIADEPTTALDATIQKQILELLNQLRAELRLAMVFITHDLGVANEIASRLCVMQDGRFVEEGPTQKLLSHPGNPYTESLLRAAPRLDRGVAAQ